MSTVDLPDTPEDRLGEVAAILAAGLLRLHARPELAATSDIPGGPSASQESPGSSRNPLELPAHTSPHPPAG